MWNIWILWSYFDPIHKWHIKIAEQALEKLNLDKVLFVPVINGIRKNAKASIEDRTNMLLMSIFDNDKFELSNIEHILINRWKINFSSFDVLCEIKKQYKDDNLFYIIWADKLLNLYKWKKFSKFNKLVSVILTAREWYNIDYDLVNYIKNKYRIKIYIINDNALLCSSSFIRDKIAKKEFSWLDSLLKKSVLDYIKKRWIY